MSTSRLPSGIEGRYLVQRLNDMEGKHAYCWYFVLDPIHDWAARRALEHYADSAEIEGKTQLADDIRDVLEDLQRKHGLE